MQIGLFQVHDLLLEHRWVRHVTVVVKQRLANVSWGSCYMELNDLQGIHLCIGKQGGIFIDLLADDH
ncbi:hypothetical protein B0E52_01505 [Rhodanobacter sp. C06]|nr:hypothetical protein B0E52_01505 [Rhodanobacter sp. C06]